MVPVGLRVKPWGAASVKYNISLDALQLQRNMKEILY